MNKSTVIIDGLSDAQTTHPMVRKCIGFLRESRIPHKVFTPAKDPIGMCIACGVCGKNTPGLCFRKDTGSEMTAYISRARLLLILTRTRYGAYEQPVKQALDRFLPLGTSFFMFKDGQMLHQCRYPGHMKQLVVALKEREDPHAGEAGQTAEEVTPEEQAVFEALVHRDAELLLAEGCKVVWVSGESEGKPVLDGIRTMLDMDERQVV